MNHGIAQRRKALGWTQGQLAERAGVAQSLVSDAERGNRANIEKVSRILSALDEAEGETDRNSSAQRERRQRDPATQAPEMAPLKLVPSAAPVAAPPVAPVDRALSLAFDGKKHSLADAYAVHPIAARLPLDGRTEGEMVTVFRGYLDAAARLRERGAQASIEALLAELTFAPRA